MFKKIIIAYYYLFYKFYKFWEYVSTPSFWSDWKAGISLMALEIWLIISVFVYYKVFVNPYIHLSESNIEAYILAFTLAGAKYIIFHHHDRWKRIVKSFDKLPKRENTIGSWVVFLLTILIIANLVYSFYLMSQIDWSQYRI